MKEGKVEHVFAFPWNRCSKAHWCKYPNDRWSPQVVHIDYLERTFDPTSGILHTKRLLTIRQNVPSIIMRILESDTESHLSVGSAGNSGGAGDVGKENRSTTFTDDGPISLFLEESFTSPKDQKLTITTTNLTQRKFLACIEKITYKGMPCSPEIHRTNYHRTKKDILNSSSTTITTKMTQTIQIHSMMGNIFYLGDVLEEFSLSSFITNSSKGRQSLLDALNRMSDRAD